MDSNKLINAWREASKDLKINIQSPFILLIEDNRNLRFDILIEDFGQPKGTIILLVDDMTDFNTPEKYGYYCSALNPLSYANYDRQLFIDTLNDWGYFGNNNEKPDWYSGQPWTDEILNDNK